MSDSRSAGNSMAGASDSTDSRTDSKPIANDGRYRYRGRELLTTHHPSNVEYQHVSARHDVDGTPEHIRQAMFELLCSLVGGGSS